MINTKTPTYISYPFGDMFVRTEIDGDIIKYFVKKDGVETESDPRTNNQLMDAILEGDKISQSEYDKA